MSDTGLDIDTGSFREYLQDYDWDCGLYTAAILTGTSKKDEAAMANLKNAIHATEAEGTDIVAMEDYFAGRPEFKARADTNWTLNGIQKELDRGRVCVVSFQNWQKPEDKGQPDWGHYGIIYKIDGDRVYLFDPGSDETEGKKDFLIADFLERWYELDFSREDRTQKILWPKWAMSVDPKAVEVPQFASKTPLV